MKAYHPETCFLTRPDCSNSHGVTQNTNFHGSPQKYQGHEDLFRHNPTYPCLLHNPADPPSSAALCACQDLVNIVPAYQLDRRRPRDFQNVFSQNCSGPVVILCGWNVMVGSFNQACGCKARQSAARSVDLLPPMVI
jgi:hypothetical protein